ncbi:phage tail tape measure protein [Pseudoalteromonas sp. CO302Y]|uniref:phage tail tape measure protein n=1 Tax=unclassified Pseudoalteromonas TaxID=194690 RepID=UPI001022DE2C|nr:phage tail tape measure protein [Pseudoalteromonas sp. CO302Y]RZG11118.1 phage tail tape measure protein [Pseudoalteromonas sp. CO133X]
MSLPQQLMFTVGLIDQITKPIAKISKGLNGLTNDYQAGTMKMASGVAGIAASGYALQNALMPAIEMDRALGEVKSLGVRESALKQLSDSSYEFALKYGKSSTEFVKSSYDIQSAISGLNDADLSAFTLSSNVLAAATKSDAGTITNYMGTMYGIFKNQANAMGKSEWVEQLTGMTATAVQAFKTTGTEMSGAFTAIGAQATTSGIAMNEQMAILGTLQATMSGSEAGTKYKSFLAGVGKAQSALNLSFTDSQGAMLPIVDILNKIKGKYGETIDVAESDQLKKAFGSNEAVATINLLMNDIEGLGKSINDLGNVTGMQQAEKMAMDMTDQSERLSQSWYVIRAAWGSAILPAFNDFVGMIADMGTGVVAFTEEFPTLTKYIGYGAVALLGLVAAGGLFTLIMGAGKMAMVAWGAGALAWAGINAALTSGLSALRAVMFAVNLVMYANPIGLVIAAVVAAVAAVSALIYYWDDLKAALADIGWVDVLLKGLEYAWKAIEVLFAPILSAIEKIADLAGIEIDFSFENIKSTLGIEAVDSSVEQSKNIPKAQESYTVPENVKSPIPNNVVPFTQPTVPLSLQPPMRHEVPSYGQTTVNENKAPPFIQPVLPEGVKLPMQHEPESYEKALVNVNNVVPFTPPVMPENFVLEVQQTEQLKSKPQSYNELPALKLERIQPQQSITNTRTASSTDNSKRVYIENVTMKSDDIARDFEKMMELAG